MALEYPSRSDCAHPIGCGVDASSHDMLIFEQHPDSVDATICSPALDVRNRPHPPYSPFTSPRSAADNVQTFLSFPMTLHDPLDSFFDQLPPFHHLQLDYHLHPPPTMPPSPPHPHNFAIATTPGVRPEQVSVSSQPLGRGSFGSVWRGTFSGCPVAVKQCPLDNPSPTALTQFRREMSRYHHLRHPCITQFFCVVQHAANLLLVTELMKGGSLFEALTHLRKSGHTQLHSASMLRIAQHVTNGLAYLHASGFSFGDLKSMNVLLSEKPHTQTAAFSPSVQAKLCDFGLSRNLKHLITPGHKSSVFDTQIPARNGPAGTFAYLAPEAFSGLPVDDASAPKAADIYALGIVLWELATLHSPWPGKQPLQLLKLVRKEARRPPWPTKTSTISDDYIALVERCWHQDASQRPSVDVVAKELDDMLRMRPDHIDPQLSFHETVSFYKRSTELDAEDNLLSDLDAIHVEDHEVSDFASNRSTEEDDSYNGLAPIKSVKSIRIGSPAGLKPCSSEMSACTAAFGTRTNSQSELTVESFAPSLDSKSLELPRAPELSMELSRNKVRRMSFISSESGPDSRNTEHLLAIEDHERAPAPHGAEYVIPSPVANDAKNIDKELRRFEDEEDLDVQQLGISMYSRPHFR